MIANVRKLYALAACEGLIFFYAFDKIFMQEHGLSLTQIILIEIIYIATLLVCEVPSGALSDRWSRKNVLALSGLFMSLYMLTYALADGFLLFAVGVIFAGMGTAFISGTNTSLLYDSLAQAKKEELYERYLGRLQAITGFVYVFAALIGGVVGSRWNLEAAFWMSLPSTVAMIFISLSLAEPSFNRSTGEVKYWQHIAQTFSYLKSHPFFLQYAGLIVAISVPMFLIDEYAQFYFDFVGFGPLGLGVLAALSGMIVAAFSDSAFRFKHLSHFNLFGWLLGGFSVSLIGAWVFQSWFGAALVLVSLVPFYIIQIIASADINRRLPSSVRATSESFFSFNTQTIQIPVAFAFAAISEARSVAAGLAALGMGLALYTVVYCLRFPRHALDGRG